MKETKQENKKKIKVYDYKKKKSNPKGREEERNTQKKNYTIHRKHPNDSSPFNYLLITSNVSELNLPIKDI